MVKWHAVIFGLALGAPAVPVVRADAMPAEPVQEIRWVLAIDDSTRVTFAPKGLLDDQRISSLVLILERDARSRLAAWAELRADAAIPPSTSDTLGYRSSGEPELRADRIAASRREMATTRSVLGMDVAYRLDVLTPRYVSLSVREWRDRMVVAGDSSSRRIDVVWSNDVYARTGGAWMLDSSVPFEPRWWWNGHPNAEASSIHHEPSEAARIGGGAPRAGLVRALLNGAGRVAPTDVMDLRDIPEVLPEQTTIGPFAAGCPPATELDGFIYYDEEATPVRRVRSSRESGRGHAKGSATVKLSVYVCENGHVGWVRVTEGDPSLNGAAVAAASQWVFAPAKRNGHPIGTWVPIHIEIR